MPNTPGVDPSRESLHDWAWRRAIQLRTLDDSVQIAKDQDRHNLVARLVRKTQDRVFGTSDPDSTDATDTLEVEPTNISIDSPVSHHYPAQPAAPVSVATKVLPWIAAALTGAGLVGAGVAASKLIPGQQINVPGGQTTVTTTKGFLIDLVE